LGRWLVFGTVQLISREEFENPNPQETRPDPDPKGDEERYSNQSKGTQEDPDDIVLWPLGSNIDKSHPILLGLSPSEQGKQPTHHNSMLPQNHPAKAG
jgi:hypothetical protein